VNLTARMRARRAAARNRRAIDQAIENAATPSMRHELIVIAQSQARRIS
jgi:hypothetical protein